MLTDLVGSYTDNVNDRTLSQLDILYWFTTAQKCSELATAGGYKYFGLEFGKPSSGHKPKV